MQRRVSSRDCSTVSFPLWQTSQRKNFQLGPGSLSLIYPHFSLLSSLAFSSSLYAIWMDRFGMSLFVDESLSEQRRIGCAEVCDGCLLLVWGQNYREIPDMEN